MTRKDHNTRGVDLIGVPTDFGANQRGVGMAPAAFRLAGLREKVAAEGIDLRDLGDINETGSRRGDSQNLSVIRRICHKVAEWTGRSLKAGRRPLVVGGDHSIAIGTVAGAAQHFRARKKTMGLLWIDAHGDMNTPDTSPSGNIHGMPLAITLGEKAFSIPFRVCHLRGFVREWTALVPLDQPAEVNGAPVRYVAYLNIRDTGPNGRDAVNGIRAAIDRQDLDLMIAREHVYDLADVTDRIQPPPALGHKVLTFIAHEPELSEKLNFAVVRDDYEELVEAACRTINPEFLLEYKNSTLPPHCPRGIDADLLPGVVKRYPSSP